MVLVNKINVFCTVTPETKDRLDNFIKSQEIAPNKTIIIETALIKFLEEKGF